MAVIVLRSLPVGTTGIGPVVAPPGTHLVSCRLDVGTSMVLGQILWLSLEVSDDGGLTWNVIATADFLGPGLDHLGLPRSTIELHVNFGGTGITPRLAGERCLVRALVTVQVAAVAITGGELAVT